MKLPFLNRNDEVHRLRRFLQTAGPGLAVVYGRRRCGKSTILQHVLQPGDIYFLADQRETALQIASFAKAVESVIPGFSAPDYRSWDAVFDALKPRVSNGLNIIIDEFPYLAQSSSDLPSILQRIMDGPEPPFIRLILCGSSQRMMQGAILDRTAPLYGRAQEILKIRPLSAGWITNALDCDSDDGVEAYAIWGGIPRYWEMAAAYPTTDAALRELLLARNGVLHDEPLRLLLEDMRSAVQSTSLLSLIGSGCHRMSELAARLGKPAGSLSRPLANLIELGFVLKELPWGENPRKSRKVLHRIADPFLRFYFRFVEPNLSLLEMGRNTIVQRSVRNGMADHVAGIWENLVRESIPAAGIGGKVWRPAARWWGRDRTGENAELDVVAESDDRRSILVGEVKWNKSPVNVRSLTNRLKERVRNLTFLNGREIVYAVWLRESAAASSDAEVVTLGPEQVLSALK